MEELYKAIGGFPGLCALLVALVAIGWRIKVPQIGVDYLVKELEVERKERTEADKDRAALRAEVQGFRVKLAELDREFLHCLADRERLRRHVRDLERQLRGLGHAPAGGDEERY